MKIFTYKDYLKCIHTLRLNAVFELAEEETKYNLESKTSVNNYLFKIILQDKEEIAQLINLFLESNRKIESKSLINYSSNYINKKIHTKDETVVYKLKNKEVFFIIEYQSILNNTMKYRTLNYCINIMQQRTKNKGLNKEINHPIIVPIIIYTGNEKWKRPENVKCKQIEDYIFQNYKINLSYNLIDVNKLSTKFLIQKGNLFGYSIILQKSKNIQELQKNKELIIENLQSKDELEKIEKLSTYVENNLLKENKL